ncbi:MAG: LamG domain-containing protein [Spirochaetaceae bacterium]|nr:LamG domain-containing protein [Spirochaetaceae bacterium]MCF7947198.1 LamG domain-containing protein [Spirochaetia bacterium]MCF7950063.1 LamG domain-containing protein [Spirochaetaceae bacterium]
MIIGNAVYGASVSYESPRFYASISGNTGRLYGLPNHSIEREVRAIRPIQVSVLPEQSLWVKIDVDYNKNLNTKLNLSLGIGGPILPEGEWAEISIGAGTHTLNIVVSFVSNGVQPIVRSISYTLQLIPNAQLIDGYDTYTGTVGSLKRVQGITHKAIEMNGEYDYVTLPDYGFRSNAERGFSCAVKTSDGGPIVQLGSETSIEIIDGKLSVRYLGGLYEINSTLVNDNIWHFIQVYYNGTDWISFIDTVESAPFSLAINTQDGLNYLGRADNRYFKGVLDNVVIMDGAINYMESVKIRDHQSPRNAELVAHRINGAIVGTLSYWDGVSPTYPSNPINGQEHLLYNPGDGSVSRKVYIDGSWR